jgi:SNF2 family DNA or RNA helicase
MRILSLSPGQRPGTAYVSFSYDPEIVEVIKQVPGREWNKTRKVWIIPSQPENIAFLRARLPSGVTVKLNPALEAEIAARAGAIASARAVRENGDSDIAFDYLTVPYAHQRAGLDFLARLGSGALLWEMGLGKTKTAIDYAEWLRQRERPGFRVLVVCPNTVKRNWGQEIEKHAGHTRYVIPDGSLKKRAQIFGTTTYTIVNCEQLSFAETAKALQSFNWDLVIVDESTRFKGPTAARTKALHKVPARCRVILSGTPITGKPEDAWAQFQYIEPGLLGSWWGFVDRYLQRNQWTRAIEGIRPGMERELAHKIESRSYRIRKDEVLDLPPKVYEDRVVELEGEQKRLYAQMRDDLRASLDGKVIDAYNILTQLLRLTQITGGLVGEGERYTWLDTGNAKLQALDELLDDLGPDERVVIFGIYQRELEALAEHVFRRERWPWVRYGAKQEYQPIIYGPTPERVRARMIDDFQQGNLSTLFVQSHTGGMGINLTAARTAIYYTRGWSLEDWLQSQDRLHRIGQAGTVTIVSLIARGTVDERIAKALGQKQNIADLLTGDAARALAREILGD